MNLSDPQIDPGLQRRWLFTKDRLIYAAIFITFCFLLLPFYTHKPSAELDFSWIFVLNEAIGKKLIFGKDIIWTYGPYGSFYLSHFHPDTFLTMILSNLYLAIAYSLCIFKIYKIKRNISIILIIPLCFIFIHEEVLRASILITMSFLLIEYYEKIKNNCLFHIFLSSMMGLLSLTKLTITCLCALYIPLIFVFFLSKNEYKLAFIYLFFPVLMIPIFWILAGQNIAHMPLFFINSHSIITGYPEGMSTSGDLFVFIMYFLFSFYTIYLFFEKSLKNNFFKAILLLLFLLSMYKISFTHAFVHEYIAISIPIFLYVLLYFFSKENTKYFLVFITLFLITKLAFFLDQGAIFFVHRPIRVIANILSIKDFYPSKQRELFEKKLTTMREEFPLPALHGTVDTYSNRQTYFLAHHLNVQFKPVIQGYSAYTPELIRANNDHLVHKKIDHIFVNLERDFFDGKNIFHFPLLIDGLSIKTLFSAYQPQSLIPIKKHFSQSLRAIPTSLLHLTRRTEFTAPKILYPIKKQRASQEETIQVPQSTNPLFAEIKFKKSLLGNGLIFLYKMPYIAMTAILNNGEKRTYRFIASMAETGFILSPLIETESEFLQLQESPKKLFDKRVSSFRMHIEGLSQAWKKHYTITWYELPNPTQIVNSFASISRFYAPLRGTALMSEDRLVNWALRYPAFKQRPVLQHFPSFALHPHEIPPWEMIHASQL